MSAYESINAQANAAIDELLEAADTLKTGDILVIGCSTSEVMGKLIGTGSSVEAAKAIMDAVLPKIKAHGLYLAVQCCEHLNRAIITERAAVPGAEIVNVVPQPKAGGSLATQVYAALKEPVALEEIKADAGLDIGLTLIGMHLKKVAVPVRLENHTIGAAMVVAARTRPKFIGGARAMYDETML